MKMTRYELLRSLEAVGTLSALYQAGMVNIRALNNRDIYECYEALRQLPRYQDNRPELIRAVMAEHRMSRRTVERAVKEMERVV